MTSHNIAIVVRGDYDTVDGIRGYLGSLEGLHLLVDRRHEAYKRREPLRSYVLLGRWHVDTTANFGRAELLDDDSKPIDPPAGMPDVLLHGDVYRYGVHSLRTTYDDLAPPANMPCVECGRFWTVADAYDSVAHEREEVHAMGPFVGLGWTLQQIIDHYATRIDGLYRCYGDNNLRHDRYIDLSLDKHDMPVNQRGWTSVEPATHRVAEGEEASFTVWRYAHKMCSRLRIARDAREEFEKLFRRAGFGYKIALTELPNGYCPCDRCPPWFGVDLPVGSIRLGWRKRVIAIDWSTTGRDLESLFLTEDVTKGPHGIHAWGHDKAVEYLRALRTALVPAPGGSS